MENSDFNQATTNFFPQNTSTMNWTNDKLGPDLFETKNFLADNSANGTSKEMFDRRNVIDRKNLVETYTGKYGLKWVS